MKISVTIKAVVFFVIAVCVIIGDINSYFSFSDELATVILLAYIFVELLRGKIEKSDRKILTLLFVIMILGLISNVTSGINVRLDAIIVDALWLYKVIVGYLCAYYVFKNEKDRRSFESLIKSIAILFVVISFFGAMLNLVADVGLSDGDIRYGLRSYCFIIGNSGHYGLISACCLGIILATEKRKQLRNVLTILACIEILLTTKFMPIIVVIVYIALFNQDELRQIKVSHVAIGAVLIALLGHKRIYYYIMDLNHPRMRLMIYGIKTAKKFFPLGSGFATYGSEMARRYYSPLYTYWGFENYYGLSPWNDSCLNDNYIAMIAAQFGVIALILYCLLLFIIYKQTVQNVKLKNKNIRNIIAALFVMMVITSLMSGTYKGAMGMSVFMTIGYLRRNIRVVDGE